MINLSYEDIVTKIKEGKSLSDEEINKKISEKLDKLGDLISKSGAAHIVANELGIKLYEFKKRIFKIKDLVAGISSVDIVGKVLTLYGVREFTRKDTIGKVASMLIGDETGTVRLVIWDTNLIEHIEKDELKEESVIRVKNAYVKENNGFKELHLGNKSILELNVKDEIGEIKFSSVVQKNESKKISELNGGEFVSVNGYIVQLFEPKFYDACSQCNKKVIVEDGKGKCEQHGDVVVRKTPILNFYLDDGSGNIRVVAFRDNVKKLISDVESLEGNAEKFEEHRVSLVGNLISVEGKAVKNEMFERVELIANNIQEFDIDSKIDELLKEI